MVSLLKPPACERVQVPDIRWAIYPLGPGYVIIFRVFREGEPPIVVMARVPELHRRWG